MKKQILLIHLFLFLCLVSFAQAPDWQWASRAGGTGTELGFNNCVDAYGNSYVTGQYRSLTITFDTITLTKISANVNNTDYYIVKYDATGKVLWVKNAGDASASTSGSSICTDAIGNIYSVGIFGSPTITFGPFTLTNVGMSYDIFIVKYDPDGNEIWARRAGGLNSDICTSVSVDLIGNTYISGFFMSDTLFFASDTLVNVGDRDIFIAKFDSAGNELWARCAGGVNDDRGNQLFANVGGNIFLTGHYYSTIVNFDSIIFHNSGDTNIYQDAFLAKYDANGNVKWVKNITGTSSELGNTAGADANGNSFVTGFSYSSTIIIDTVVLSNIGDVSGYVAKYDPNGYLLWARLIGGTDDVGAESISIDSKGNAYVAGLFKSPVLNFGNTTLVNTHISYPASSDVFVVKYDPYGNELWAKSAGGNTDECIYSIYVDAGGCAYVTGMFQSPTMAFGNTILTTAGWNDIFLAKLECEVTSEEKVFSESDGFKIYPNPTTHTLTIEALKSDTKQTVEIFNIVGQLIYSSFITKKTIIDVFTFPKGVYLIKFKSEDSLIMKKVIKE